MGFIFEKEIGSIVHAVLARTIGEEDSVRMKRILPAVIHPGIKAYCKEEVERLLREERKKEQRSPRFPYSQPEVLALQKQIDLLLVKNYEFDREEFNRLVDESVHFQFNYLCRPQWTLLNFIFQDQRRVPVSKVYQRLHYCVDYPYFPQIIKRYIEERDLAELEYDELRRIIEIVDAQVIEPVTPESLSKLLRPLFLFLEIGLPLKPASEDEITIPTNAVIIFTEDKKLDKVKIFLEMQRDREQVENVTIPSLTRLLHRILDPVAPEEKVAPEKIALEPLEQIIRSVLEKKSLASSPQEEAFKNNPSAGLENSGTHHSSAYRREPDFNEPFSDVVFVPVETDNGAPPRSEKIIETPEPISRPAPPEKFSARFETQARSSADERNSVPQENPVVPPAGLDSADVNALDAEQAESAPPAYQPPLPTLDLPDLTAILTKHERKRFVRKIFRRDEVEFRNAIDELNACASWEEAAVYVDRIFVKNDIDPFSGDAVHFTDVIQSRYAPEE